MTFPDAPASAGQHAGALPLAVSCGDPSGVGPDIALAAWERRLLDDLPPFYLLADPNLIMRRARTVGSMAKIEVTRPDEAIELFARALPVVPLDARFADTPGHPDSANSAGIVEAIDRAVSHVLAGRAAAVVTCPIAKKPLYDAGFRFPGHTEYLAELASRHLGHTVTPVMMLAGPELRTVPVTIHISLAAAARQLTTAMIVETGEIVARDLGARFGLSRPRLAVAGLNPHAGEGGSMGQEEETVVRPAVEQLRALGIDAFGPLPADTMFHARARAGYDVALCMYHDQALIPAKTLAFDEAVNVTLGLPFVRTSPDHGTAFDIAGKGVARADSLIAALKLARTMGAGS